MFQPEVKLEFVRQYCSPSDGWKVFVDIDASEEGKTGGPRKSREAKKRRNEMKADAARVRSDFESLDVRVDGSRKFWLEEIGAAELCRSFSCVATDRDIVAVHFDRQTLIVAEVEGASSGQPEQKLYKAIGQLVLAVAEKSKTNWRAVYVLAVHGKEIAAHLKRASSLVKIGISAVHIKCRDQHEWLFQDALLPKLLSGELRVPTKAKL